MEEPNKQSRIFDLVVFGATGVTGKYVMEELANHHPSIKWAAAGRNREKIDEALKEVVSFTGKSLENVGVILADVNDADTLKKMCLKTKVVINCVGPFRFFGEKVINIAIECGTHHLDVSGEPQFLMSTQCKYFDMAKENKVYVIGACGFDSIPCDVGIEVIKKKFPGDVFAVETFLELQRAPGATANFATWQSAIHGFSHRAELKPLWKELRNKLFKKTDPELSHWRSALKLERGPLFKKSIPKVTMKIHSGIHISSYKSTNRWCIPFVGSDRSVASRSQLYDYNFDDERQVDVFTYFCLDSLFTTIGLLFLGLVFAIFCKFSYGQYLLEQYPELFSYGAFSKKPPAREEEEKSSYTMTFQAIGWPEKLEDQQSRHANKPTVNMDMVLTAQDNGYVTTAICVVSAAEVVLHEIERLPDEGGVFTPGTAFKNTSLVEKMEARGLKYNTL